MAKIVVIAGFAESLLLFRGKLLEELVSRGHKVIACAPENSKQVIDGLAKMGVEYRQVRLHRTGLNPMADLVAFAALVTLMRECRPDMVLSYTIKPVIYGSLVARILGIQRIYSMITGLGYAFMGGTIRHHVVGSIAAQLYRLALRFNHRVFFQNPDDLDVFVNRQLIQTRAQGCLVNGSGVDIDEFQVMPLPNKTSFLMICRLLRDKGVCEYVAAARQLRKKFPDLRFQLVGWIDDQPTAISEQELQEWQVEGSIEYLGRLNDVRPAIAESLVYVLPSYREGTPRTVLEAMAMGRPIISCDVPGCRETVQEGKNGFLVPAKDSVQLARAMERFVDNPDIAKAMGKHSRQICEEKYDVHKVNQAILRGMGLDNG